MYATISSDTSIKNRRSRESETLSKSTQVKKLRVTVIFLLLSLLQSFGKCNNIKYSPRDEIHIFSLLNVDERRELKDTSFPKFLQYINWLITAMSK